MKETETEKENLLSGAVASGGTASSSPRDVALPARDPEARITNEELARTADAARQETMELQRQLQEVQRLKNEVEELRRKKDEYESGRAEMLERLSRCLVLLEHEQVATTRKAESIANALASFKSSKEQLGSIHDELWNNANLKEELVKALAVVDTARNELNHYRARLDVLDEQRNPEAAVAAGPLAEFMPGEGLLPRANLPDLVKLVKIGLALSLPLLLLGIILLIVLVAKR